MKKLHQYAAVAALTAVMALSGCGGSVSYKPETSGIFVMKDGKIESAEVESFDNTGFSETRYEEEGLRSFVQDAVCSFNKDTCGQEAAYEKDAEGLNVSIVDLSVKDSVAKLVLKYSSCEQYIAFNEADDSVTKLEFYTAPDAVAHGVSLDGLVSDDGKAVDSSSIQTNEKYHAVVVNGTTEVVIDGKIVGVSDGGQQTEKHTVAISGDKDVVILFK